MIYTITRKLEFDAGHRVYMHESKCAHPHGHRYVCEVTCRQVDDDLDDLGRVIDFGVIKKLCGGWIDDNWDHGMIIYRKDQLMVDLYDTAQWKEQPLKCYYLPDNPTAENMAKYLYYKFGELLAPHDIKVTHIKLWETPNCFAVYE